MQGRLWDQGRILKWRASFDSRQGLAIRLAFGAGTNGAGRSRRLSSGRDSRFGGQSGSGRHGCEVRTFRKPGGSRRRQGRIRDGRRDQIIVKRRQLRRDDRLVWNRFRSDQELALV